MVYGRYNELVNGVYEPTNITGGYHPVWGFPKNGGSPSSLDGDYFHRKNPIENSWMMTGGTPMTWETYPLVKSHSYGKSPLLMRKSTK